jgi:hypothetical protein
MGVIDHFIAGSGTPAMLAAARQHGARGTDGELMAALRESFFEPAVRIGLDERELAFAFWFRSVVPQLPRDEREPLGSDGTD